jgi:hypothetical protein
MLPTKFQISEKKIWKLSFYILPLFFSQINGVKIKLSFHFIQSEPNKTRGPQEHVISHLVFNLTSKVYRNNFKSLELKPKTAKGMELST